MNGWIPLQDGMNDPYPDDDLAHRRRQAIDDLLKLMGCHCLKSANCDHVDAISDLGGTIVETMVMTFEAVLRPLPRPLTMRSIEEALAKIGLVTLTSANPEHQREHR